MEFTFLGTSAGLPTAQRNVSSVVLSNANSKAGYMVDCGEGTQHQLLRCRYAARNLEGIFITHVHGDHVFGLFGLLSSMVMSGRNKPLPIFGPEGVAEMIETVLRLSDSHRASFELEHHITQPGEIFSDDRFRVEAIALSHRVPSFAYQFTQHPQTKLKIDALRATNLPPQQYGTLQRGNDVEYEGQVFRAADYLEELRPLSVIIGGDNDRPELLHDNAKRADVIVHEATFTEEVSARIGPSPMHSTGLKIGQAAHEAEVKNLVLTHFSSRYADIGSKAKVTVADIEAEARQAYAGRLFLANDFDRFSLNRDGVLRLEAPQPT